MAVVVDASVVIGFLDPSDATHEQAVAAFEALGDDQVVLPASALAEVLVGAHQRGAAAVRIVGAFLEDAGIRIEPMTEETARAAAQLRARHPRIRLPDALVLATGQILAARSIVTADRAWHGVAPRVRVI
jgi:predicted nucleic acid-binding protein